MDISIIFVDMKFLIALLVFALSFTFFDWLTDDMNCKETTIYIGVKLLCVLVSLLVAIKLIFNQRAL